MWKRLLIGAGYGVIGLLVAIGLTFSAYAVAGRDLAEPATPIGSSRTLAPTAGNGGSSATQRTARQEHRQAVHDRKVAHRAGSIGGGSSTGLSAGQDGSSGSGGDGSATSTGHTGSSGGSEPGVTTGGSGGGGSGSGGGSDGGGSGDGGSGGGGSDGSGSGDGGSGDGGGGGGDD